MFDAKCPYCQDGCDRCNNGYVEATLSDARPIYTIQCLNEECKFVNGAHFGKPNEPSGSCCVCYGETRWVEADSIVEDENPPWVKNRQKFEIQHLEKVNEDQRNRIKELQSFAVSLLGDRVLSLQEAKMLNVCRICKGAVTVPFVYNYGKEYAHTQCLGQDSS